MRVLHSLCMCCCEGVPCASSPVWLDNIWYCDSTKLMSDYHNILCASYKTSEVIRTRFQSSSCFSQGTNC